ncbi:MAG TPA: hypothetical protein PKC43_10225 [Phycisphaerales bacterium]|nr:hypothetical protein [Phycisphaerales bacterium]HMP37812.1 hypothetical protein [Phycisphaerales bacterium]
MSDSGRPEREAGEDGVIPPPPAPRATSGPLSDLRRRRRLLWLVGMPIVASAWGWALVLPEPIEPQPGFTSKASDDTPSGARSATGSELAVTPLPIAGFVRAAKPRPAEVSEPTEPAPIAVAAPAPEADESGAAPDPRIDLVGIVVERGTFRAAVYLPAEDRLIVVSEGDRIGPFLIRRVSAGEIELESGMRVITIKLPSASGWERRS